MNTIKLSVEKRYLVIPISSHAELRSIRIKPDGKLYCDFSARLDFDTAETCSIYDASAILGKTVEIEVAPDMDISGFADCQTDVHTVKEYNTRPAAHFTAPFGWINDPNGLVVYTSKKTGKTTYHLFCQHNPYDYIWGNMHWAHAVSEDLMHWEYRGIALAPDENGTMFSGSAVVDTENRSGLKNGEEDVILLYYTCAGNTSVLSEGKKFTQCLAYSTDGGETFTKYEKNPIVGHIAADNRDPKVIWCAELGRYVMAIYLDGNEYCLLVSDDLLNWSELQRVHIEGDAECPDIYPLTASDGKRKWVISGASHHYIVGEFIDGKFIQCGGTKALNYGRTSYAAQTYSYPNEERRIQLAWDRDIRFGDAPICGQMGIPCEMSLTEYNGEYYLSAYPTVECENCLETVAELDNVSGSVSLALENGAYTVEVELDDDFNSAEIELFGQKIALDGKSNTIRVYENEIPLTLDGCEKRVLFVADRGTLEIFVGGGRAITTIPWAYDTDKCKCVSDICGKVKKITIKEIKL